MEAAVKYKVSEIFSRYKFSVEDAQFISEVLNDIDDRQNQKFEASKELFLTQKDKVELIAKIGDVEIKLSEKISDVEVRLTEKISDIEVRLTEKIGEVDLRFNEKMNNLQRSVYIVGLVQFFAIIASILAIFNFMLK